MSTVPSISPENIQFFCAEWFWKKQVNSYVLQVEPARFKHQDTANIGFKEAIRIEKIRDEVFAQVAELPGKITAQVGWQLHAYRSHSRQATSETADADVMPIEIG